MPRFGQNQTMKRETFNSEVNVERDSRIGGGFYYGTHKFDWDEAAKARVTGAASLAGFAIGAGAQPNDLRWHGGDTDFGWILQDNTVLPLDAQGMFAVSQAALAHESKHIFAAHEIKRTGSTGADISKDTRWPL